MTAGKQAAGRKVPALRKPQRDPWLEMQPALREIAGEYVQWRERDALRPSIAKLRAELRQLSGRALAANSALADLSETARGILGQAPTLKWERVQQQIASAAIQSADGLPSRSWVSAARRQAAFRLRVLLANRGVPFTAYAGDDGSESIAVRAFRRVLQLANERMSSASARKWIEEELKAGKPSAPETR